MLRCGGPPHNCGKFAHVLSDHRAVCGAGSGAGMSARRAAHMAGGLTEVACGRVDVWTGVRTGHAGKG
eukprot:214976-Chlamydomonas_euryale.AAC.2